ncbi:tRNA dihydrouridine synthase [Helicobacter sp. T3_23-1059]
MIFENLLFLAPLAGYTDLPFRKVVKRFGVDITVSEMISSHALAFSSAKTLKMISKSPNETPFSVQIAGSKPDIITKAIEVLNAQNQTHQNHIDILDFNCGCPAPKVANHGNGSGLLKDLDLLVKCLNLIKEKTNATYTSVKVRLGFDKKIPLEIANALNDANVDFVVAHARTKTDAYKKERIDYNALASMKQILSHPLIANGEIDSPSKAIEVLDFTGANGVMIGRAALKSPWIFWQIKQNLKSSTFSAKSSEKYENQELPKVIKREIVLEHFDSMIDFYGERGAIMFRKNLHAYAKGEEGASAFRNVVNNMTNPKSMREAIEEFFDSSLIVSPLPQIIKLNQKSV